jgi:hypothetical protein
MREWVVRQIIEELRNFLCNKLSVVPPFGIALACGTEDGGDTAEEGDLMLHIPQSKGAIVCTGPLTVGGFPLLTTLNLNTTALCACVVIVYDPKLRCFQLKTMHPCEGRVWLGVGNYIPRVHGTPGLPAMILQCNTVFRVGSHVFKITACPAVRPRMLFSSMVAPAPNPHTPVSRVSGSVPQEIEADEQAEMHITCTSPTSSACVNKIIKFVYHQGGHRMKIGDTEQCMFRIRDGSVKGVACHIVALQGHFWLVNGDTDEAASEPRTFVKVCPFNTTPLPLRSSYGPIKVYIENYLVNVVVTRPVSPRV